MSNAVTPKWHGDNYQARVFWDNVLNLLDPDSGVIEVSFEADGPKAFDDVVVKYDSGRVSSGPERITADYHQVKWHVEYGGRFGYKDFVEPSFIGAESFSLLQRLAQAKESADVNACFNFITVYRITDDDPLSKLISGVDKSLLIDKLFDGSKTDKSKMGAVRKLWREHLKLSNNEDLKKVLQNLKIFEGHRSLDELRTQINLKAQVVGLLACSNTSDFRYDELAKQLKSRKLNVLNRELLKRICQEEGLVVVEKENAKDAFLQIAIRSFIGLSADVVGASLENTLMLTEHFQQRYLQSEKNWQQDIRPMVDAFLKASVKKSIELRIILDAHASIAFLTGVILDFKSGVSVELIQKGRVGSCIWRIENDANANSPYVMFDCEESAMRNGNEIVLAINVTHNTTAHVKKYVSNHLTDVGKILSLNLLSGPGQQSIGGANHAIKLAEQTALIVRRIKEDDPDKILHIFAACPNAFLFYLGQQHQSFSPCIIYEFDFDRKGNKTYHPSFIIE